MEKYLNLEGLTKFKEELEKLRLADKLELTGALNDLSGDIGNGTFTVKRNNITVGSFYANQKTNDEINIVVPTSISDLGQTAITEILNLINYGLLDVSDLTEELKEALHESTLDNSDFVDETSLSTELANYGKIINYDSSTKMIQLKNGNIVLSQFSAQDFLVDGMLEDVRITNGTGDNAGKSVLLIDFNTESGIADIEIPLELIFNANNYYTKTEIDNAGFLTQHQDISGKADKSEMSITSTNGTATIQLKSGTSVNVLTQHQDISGKANSADLAEVATSGSYNDLSNKPDLSQYLTQHQDISGKANSADLATVATSGSYNDLSDKPTVPSLSGYATELWVEQQGYLTLHLDISGKANSSDLATVATSGDYNDLINKPTIPSLTGYATETWVGQQGYLTQHQDISGKANSSDLATVATSGSYADLSNKPTIYSALEITNIIKYGVADTTGYSAQELENLEKYGVADISELTEQEIEQLEEEKGQYAKVSDLSVYYDSTTSKIQLKNGSDVISEFSASAFISDGMVDSVAISNGNLVITWNSAAGKQATSIPITDIFNASNYYTKTDSDSRYIRGVKSGTTSLTPDANGIVTVPEAAGVRIITLSSAPTSSTLTYTLDGVTYNFKPGDEVRVQNGDNDNTNDYQIYKLYDLVTEDNVTTAYWSESGSGDGLDDIVETCIINLSTTNSTYNSELVGVATVTFTIDGQDTVKTWNGNPISMKILTGTSYTVAIGNVSGFTTPSGFTRTAVAANTQEFNGIYTYRNISVTVGTNQNSLTDLIGATIEIDGTEFEINNSQSTTQTFTKHVASTNNSVSFVFGSVSGYRSPSITDDGSQDSFNVTYDTEILSVTTVTTDSGTVTGQSITVDNDTKTWLGTTLTWKIPFGNSDVITTTKEGFTVEIIKNPNTDIADSVSKTATIAFEEIVEGVYAYSNKKREVTNDNISSTTLDSGEYYIGVLVRASGIEFVIDKRFPTGTAAASDSGNYKSWSPALYGNDPASASDGRQLIYHGSDYGSGSNDSSNYYTTGAPTNLRTWATQNHIDGHTGFANTELIRKLSTVAAETATNNALKYCHACVTEINNRAIYGYVGSIAEWIAVLDNITEINSILSKIGGTQFTYSASGNSSYSRFWASNEYDSSLAWSLGFSSSGSYPYMGSNVKSGAGQSYCARPFYLPNLYTTEIKVVTANGSVVNIEDGDSTCVGVLVRNTYENIEYFIDKRFPTGSAAGANVGNYKSWYSSNTSGGTTVWSATTKTNPSTFGEGITTDFREKAITAYLGGATGVQNTNTIISTLSSGTATNCAAKYCRSIANPVTGTYDGYLGSAAEWILVADNLSLINEALTQIGGVTFESITSGYISTGTSYTRWWTSSEYNSGSAWSLDFSSSYSYPYMYSGSKSYADQICCARPFFKLS